MRGQRHAPAALYPGKDAVPIVHEAGWAPGPVWTGGENLTPTGIRSQDRPARSQSLYRLRYPAHDEHRVALYRGLTEHRTLKMQCSYNGDVLRKNFSQSIEYICAQKRETDQETLLHCIVTHF